ncbi:hypothetical protein OCS_00904 [Ophiocordyceps sinensis CO18]|nr:hypothetical protein OCS_00904 [Ophiocordyceps sinensis CO18]
MRDQGNERVVEAKRRKKKEKKEEKKEGEWTRKKKAERKACKCTSDMSTDTWCGNTCRSDLILSLLGGEGRL